MNIVMRPIGEVIPYARNPRKNDGAVDAVAASIKEFGFRQPIVVDEKGVIIVGHTRWKAAQKLGMSEVPVHVAEGLSPLKARAYRLADNKTNELADWNMELLTQEMDEEMKKAMADLGLDFEMPTEEGTADAEPQIDHAEELNKKWQVKTGDLFSIGNHRLLCGDAARVEDVTRIIEKAGMGMMITDPPYNVNYEGNYIQSGKILSQSEKIWHGGIENDNHSDFPEWLSLVYSVCDSVLNEGAAIYVWHPSSNQCRHFWNSWLWDKWHFQVDLCWNKTSLIINMWDYKPQHEPCMYGWKGKGRKWIGPNNEPTVWDIPRQQGASGGKRNHPTQKPLECMARPMRNHDAQEIYDPFIGSGTTMVAAQNLNRKCYGIEISPNYCAVILQRMTDAFPGIEIKRIESGIATEVKTE